IPCRSAEGSGTAQRSFHAGDARRDDPRRMRRSRLYLRFGMEGIPKGRHSVRDQAACGVEGIRQATQTDFYPATKSSTGHDENISCEEMGKQVGSELSERLRDLSLRVYQAAADYAATRGIIIADTKFEFGTTPNGIVLADEVLTPDSSRFWPADKYQPGQPQESYDKQYVRDYLESVRWNKQPPTPALPDEVAERTSQKYREAYERLTGRALQLN